MYQNISTPAPMRDLYSLRLSFGYADKLKMSE